MADVEMVERVARALWADRHPETPAWPSEIDRLNYMGHARAAIEALREPTDQMVLAGVPEIQSDSPQTDARECWAAMIDAILKEESWQDISTAPRDGTRCAHTAVSRQAEGWWNYRQCTNKALPRQCLCVVHFPLPLPAPPGR